ncbi:MAG: dihydrolipoamide acyltransferase [Clostridia bacterium]|nr:hotdog domain-containing protein [Lachnospiraceae bacterium]NCB99784.1 dihydrolipoamide acyltransferase [Clostridia bacterium]NCD01931.1 dihydrolipoamide acyltransferase [Clostridia bacterium]
MEKAQLLNTTFTFEQVVTEDMTASKGVPGTPDVFGTPMLVMMVENTCFKCMAQAAEEGEVSVGVTVDITHSSPTPVGMKVVCTAKVEKVDKKILTFSFEVKDEAGVIGTGTHVRAYVQKAKIEAKAAAKFNK